MTRHCQHERPIWFEECGPICQCKTDKFVAELPSKPGVSRVLLNGSVAREKPW